MKPAKACVQQIQVHTDANKKVRVRAESCVQSTTKPSKSRICHVTISVPVCWLTLRNEIE